MVETRQALVLAFGEETVKALEAMCLCPDCPSYPQQDYGRKNLYCLRGKSEHAEAIEPVNCFCEQCEVYKHAKLYGSNFFCLEGIPEVKGARNVLRGALISGLVHMKERRQPTLVVSSGLDVHEYK